MAQLLVSQSSISAADCEALMTAFRTGCADRVFHGCGERIQDVEASDVAARTVALTIHLPTLVAQIHDEVKRFFKLDGIEEDYTAYTVCRPGGSHRLHADALELDGRPNHTPHRIATAILYLNDWGVDFQGGELCFPRLDRFVRPARGLVVGMLTGLDFAHEVKTVTQGERHALVMWCQRP